MTLFGWCTTKEIAACFSLFVVGVFCYILAPYPFCYTYESKTESATEVRLNFVKNEFFKDCSIENKMKVKTDKDVVVYLDGKVHKKIRRDEVCPPLK